MSGSYYVTTKHRTMPSLSGTFVFTVDSADYGNGELFYAKAARFGCSKLYSSPESAIREMCADHAVTVISIRKNGT